MVLPQESYCSIDYVIFLLTDSQFCAVDETCPSTVMKQLLANTLSKWGKTMHNFVTKDSLTLLVKTNHSIFSPILYLYYMLNYSIIYHFSLLSRDSSPWFAIFFAFIVPFPLQIPASLCIWKLLLFLCSHHLVSHICAMTHICQSCSCPSLQCCCPNFPPFLRFFLQTNRARSNSQSKEVFNSKLRHLLLELNNSFLAIIISMLLACTEASW